MAARAEAAAGLKRAEAAHAAKQAELQRSSLRALDEQAKSHSAALRRLEGRNKDRPQAQGQATPLRRAKTAPAAPADENAGVVTPSRRKQSGGLAVASLNTRLAGKFSVTAPDKDLADSDRARRIVWRLTGRNPPKELPIFCL